MALSAFGAMQQRPVNAYAAQRFNEWQQNAAEREAAIQLKLQVLQSQAETAGLEIRNKLYNQAELQRQVNMYNYGMPRLREQLKNAGINPGDPRFAKEISEFALSIPDAFTHVPSIQKDLHDLSQTDKTASELADKIKTFSQGYEQGTGQTPTNVHVGQGGEITGGAGTGIPEKIADRYSRLQGAIELHKAQAATQKQSDINKKIADNPYAQQAQLNAAQTDAKILENAYPKLRGLNPMIDQGFNQDFEPANTDTTASTPTATPEPSPTPEPNAMPKLRWNPDTGEYE